MRVPVLVYALVYLVVEMIGAQLAEVQWARITPLIVAAAIADALVVVAVLVAVLVAADLTKHRWRPAVHAWLHAHGQPHSGWWGGHRHDHPHHHAHHRHHGHDHGHDHDHDRVVGVTSWRPERPALPMGSPSAAPTARYAAPTYAASGTPAPPARPFATDDDRLL